MLANFKFRLGLVLVVSTVCFALTGDAAYEERLAGVLSYIMQPNETIEEAVAVMFGLEAVPGRREGLDRICDYTEVLQPFGPFTSAQGQEQFCGGVYLKTRPNRAVRAAVAGRIETVALTETTLGVLQTEAGTGRMLFYSGLLSVTAAEGEEAAAGDVIGACGEALYIEVREDSGFINPEFIFAR
jgi:hypothetical protein